MIKKWIAAVAAVLLMLGAVPVAAQETQTYDLSEQAAIVKIVGRALETEDGIAPYTTGAGMAFYADCAGNITVTVTGSSMKWDRQCFSVFVDGKEQERVVFDCPQYKEATADLVIAEDLAAGMHRIELYRDTEEVFGEVTFHSITLDGTISPVPDAPLMMEFIGDSLTCGYASYPHEDKKLSVEHPLWEAGSKSFAFLTARALGADFQSVCASGYGIVCGWNGDRVTLSDMYDYASYYNSDETWDFERTADVVVINLGTNDDTRMKAWNKTVEDISDGIRALLEQVREHNPDAKIVWATGMAGVKFGAELQAHIAALGGADAGYYYVELPYGMSSDGSHPTIEEHQAAAQALTAFLQSDVLPTEYAAQMMTAQKAGGIDTSALSETLAETLALEIAIAAESEDMPGILTGLCQAENLQAAVQNDTPTGEDESSSVTLIVIIAVAAVAIVGLAAFAVLYKPKKKA